MVLFNSGQYGCTSNFLFLMICISSWFNVGPNVNTLSMSIKHDDFCALCHIKPLTRVILMVDWQLLQYTLPFLVELLFTTLNMPFIIGFSLVVGPFVSRL